MIYEHTVTLELLLAWQRRLARETRAGMWWVHIGEPHLLPLLQTTLGRFPYCRLNLDPSLAEGFAAEYIPA